jgi:hypothetical protein
MPVALHAQQSLELSQVRQNNASFSITSQTSHQPQPEQRDIVPKPKSLLHSSHHLHLVQSGAFVPQRAQLPMLDGHLQQSLQLSQPIHQSFPR